MTLIGFDREKWLPSNLSTSSPSRAGLCNLLNWSMVKLIKFPTINFFYCCGLKWDFFFKISLQYVRNWFFFFGVITLGKMKPKDPCKHSHYVCVHLSFRIIATRCAISYNGKVRCTWTCFTLKWARIKNSFTYALEKKIFFSFPISCTPS